MCVAHNSFLLEFLSLSRSIYPCASFFFFWLSFASFFSSNFLLSPAHQPLQEDVNARDKYKDIYETLRRITDPTNDFYVYRPRADLMQSPALFSFSMQMRDLAQIDEVCACLLYIFLLSFSRLSHLCLHSSKHSIKYTFTKHVPHTHKFYPTI